MNIVMPGKAAAFAARQREKTDKLRAQHGIEPQPWYRITNAVDPDEVEVMLYDEVGSWYGTTADQFIADLRGITAPNIRLRVNSPGGSVFEGIAIANALRSHPATVVCQVDGIAASIASVIAMAADRVEMSPNTMVMIHDAAGFCMGDASDMEEMAELLDLISDNLADAYAAKAGGTREQWRELMRAETWFLPDDAVEAGLADEALKTPKTGTPVTEPAAPGEAIPQEPEMHKQFDLTAYGYQGPKQPEAPKPGPPPAASEQQVTLTFNVGESLDEQILALLRKSVAARNKSDAVGATGAAAPTVAAQPKPVDPQVPEVTDTASPAAVVDPAPDAAPEPAAEAEPQLAVTATEPEPDTPTAVPEPVATVEPEAPEPDAWAAAVARLTQPKPDPWASAFAHLINHPQPSSSAATAA